MDQPDELSPHERHALEALLWAANGEEQDRSRWMQQGFEFFVPSDAERASASAWQWSFGLVQSHGGPCGVFAVVQAEMVRTRLFECQQHLQQHNPHVTSEMEKRQYLLSAPMDDHERETLLAQAIASILYNAARWTPPESSNSSERVIRLVWRETTTKESECCLESSVKAYSGNDPALVEKVRQRLGAFYNRYGVINLMYSVMRTKGVEVIRAEMDDSSVCLTGEFGHCNQELVNLLITGQAVSNVFDGVVPMGDTGLMLKGAPERSRLGYLSQLEALRYCQVGSYFKSPLYPVWVIGSASHFSILFGIDMSLCEESSATMLLHRAQRVFKSFDRMESGFIEIGAVADSIKQLGVSREILESEYYMTQLISRLELGGGGGIVIWEEYWKVLSVLLHTQDFELAVHGNYTSSGSTPSRPRSDSDIARELQAQFDAEQNGTPLAHPSNPTPSIGSPEEQESFDIYFYNGLRSKQSEFPRCPLPLIKCPMRIPKAHDVIGKSVPLNADAYDTSNASPPLEAVIKTKWPDVRFNWHAAQIPSID